jgi:hypothetical protein
MVDISTKIRRITAMVDQGCYFTINRARQLGKTTTLNQLEKRLFHQYSCGSISFEGIGEEPFATPKAFCRSFMELVQQAPGFSFFATDTPSVERWVDTGITDFKGLSLHVDNRCRGRKIIFMIDEADKMSNNRTYIHFLGVLRDKYLARKMGRAFTFQGCMP